MPGSGKKRRAQLVNSRSKHLQFHLRKSLRGVSQRPGAVGMVEFASDGRRIAASHPIAAPAAHKAPRGAFLPELAPTIRASVGAVFSGRAHGSALPGQPCRETAGHLPTLAASGVRQGAEMLGQTRGPRMGSQSAGQRPRADGRNHVLVAGRFCVSRVPHFAALQALPVMDRVTECRTLHSGAFAQ